MLLVNAFAMAVEQGFNSNLILIGNSDKCSVIECKIADHSLAQCIELCDCCTGLEIQDTIAQCQVLILSSFAGSLPVIIIKTMACAHPILSTNQWHS